MTEKKGLYPVPKFKNLEEEDQFWQTHDPMTEGYKFTIQRNPQPVSSFLSVRMTGREIDELREVAAKAGMGVSTFARQVLRAVIEQAQSGKKTVSLERVVTPEEEKYRAAKEVMGVGERKAKYKPKDSK